MHRGDCAHERVSFHPPKGPSCPVVAASSFHNTHLKREADASNIDNRFVTHVCLYLKHAVTDSTRDATRFASQDHYRAWRGRRPECPLVRVERKCVKKLELRQAHLNAPGIRHAFPVERRRDVRCCRLVSSSSLRPPCSPLCKTHQTP